ncbi:Serine/threonine protein kinase, partial [Globisporangium splendens]
MATNAMTDRELQDSVDTHLLPNMMDLNVSDAFDIISNLCHEMRESEILCRRLDTRLAFLRSHPRELHQAKKVPVFANTLGHVIAFLKKYSAKKLLQRIALNRIITQRVRTLHEDISELFRATKLDHVPEMSDWLRYLEQDIANQLSLLEQLTSSHQVSTELVGGSLEEALIELKFEIDGRINKPEVTELMARVLASVEARAGCEPTPQVPRWYIRRDDVELVGDIIDCGSFGEVYKAKWGADKTDVAVKSLYLDTPDAQKSFLNETQVWYILTHPNIIKMHGGCHVGKPLFFVAEYASEGNFADFFKDNEENKRQMWRLFHQAAQGLLHLHTRTPTIVHGDIKCNNMLIGSDGKAKLCDFGYAHIKTLSVGKSIKEQPSAVRWKAPECLLGQGVEANPSTASDTYAFGMSIIEAVIGDLPYGVADDESIINQVASGDGYPRPATGFTDKEWNLAQKLTAFDPSERMKLKDAVKELAELAEMCSVLCPSCHKENGTRNNFCGACGKPLSVDGA